MIAVRNAAGDLWEAPAVDAGFAFLPCYMHPGQIAFKILLKYECCYYHCYCMKTLLIPAPVFLMLSLRVQLRFICISLSAALKITSGTNRNQKVLFVSGWLCCLLCSSWCWRHVGLKGLQPDGAGQKPWSLTEQFCGLKQTKLQLLNLKYYKRKNWRTETTRSWLFMSFCLPAAANQEKSGLKRGWA